MSIFTSYKNKSESNSLSRKDQNQICDALIQRINELSTELSNVFTNNQDTIIEHEAFDVIVQKYQILLGDLSEDRISQISKATHFKKLTKEKDSFIALTNEFHCKVDSHNQIVLNNKSANALLERIGNMNEKLNSALSLYNGRSMQLTDRDAIIAKVRSFLSVADKKILELTETTAYPQLKSAIYDLESNLKGFDVKVGIHNSHIWTSLANQFRDSIQSINGTTIDVPHAKCIVKDAYTHLILGTSPMKNTVLVGRIKYLLSHGYMLPEDILILSNSSSAAAELNQHVYNETGSYVDSTTFVELSANIASTAYNKQPSQTTVSLSSFIKERLMEYTKDPEYAHALGSYIFYNRVVAKSEFDFSSQDEYDEYLRINPPFTAKGEFVDNYGELAIANFLYQNGIDYEYKVIYKFDASGENEGKYYVDFYLPKYKIYIEYLISDRAGNVPSFFVGRDGMSAKELYRVTSLRKKKLHKTNKTNLIRCYAYEMNEGIMLSTLTEKLLSYGVEFNPVSAANIWKRISREGAHTMDGIVELFETIINILRSSRQTIDDIRAKNVDNYNINESTLLLDLVEPVLYAYNAYLAEHKALDENSILTIALNAIESGHCTHNYKLIIVDDYQTMTAARVNLLKKMRIASDFDLLCFGDDWRCTYRRIGADIDYICNFSKYWGVTEVSRMEPPLSMPKSLAILSGNFIRQNPMQNKWVADGYQSNGSPIGEIRGETEVDAVNLMSDKIKELPPNSTVLFIGRYWFDHKMLARSYFFDCNEVTNGVMSIKHHKRNDLRMYFVTAHQASKLQADYVFIINNRDGHTGFPSRMQEAPAIGLMLEKGTEYQFGEERRLFYIALTRARKKTMLLTISGQESVFVRELKDQNERYFKFEGSECPWCGSNLSKKRSDDGSYWVCSNQKITGCGFTRIASQSGPDSSASMRKINPIGFGIVNAQSIKQTV